MRLILPMVVALAAAMTLAGCANPGGNPPAPQSTAGKAPHAGGGMGGS